MFAEKTHLRHVRKPHHATIHKWICYFCDRAWPYPIWVVVGHAITESQFSQLAGYIPWCTYTHIHVHTYTSTHVHTYTHTHVHTYTHTHVHTYTRAHIHTYTRTHVFIHIYRAMIVTIAEGNRITSWWPVFWSAAWWLHAMVTIGLPHILWARSPCHASYCLHAPCCTGGLAFTGCNVHTHASVWGVFGLALHVYVLQHLCRPTDFRDKWICVIAAHCFQPVHTEAVA